MIRLFTIVLLAAVSVFFMQCKKETEDWTFCNCTIESWVGAYKGTGNYYEDEATDARVVEVEIVIERFAAYNLTVKIDVPDLYAETFYATKDDSAYYINVNANNKSLVINLKKKGVGFKVTGTAKNYHMEVEQDTSYVVTDKVVSFNALKTSE